MQKKTKASVTRENDDDENIEFQKIRFLCFCAQKVKGNYESGKS